MAITGTDIYGPYIDTGVGSAPTQRANVEVEVHLASEIDSGSKLAPTTLPTTHIPHRAVNSPR